MDEHPVEMWWSADGCGLVAKDRILIESCESCEENLPLARKLGAGMFLCRECWTVYCFSRRGVPFVVYCTNEGRAYVDHG